MNVGNIEKKSKLLRFLCLFNYPSCKSNHTFQIIKGEIEEKITNHSIDCDSIILKEFYPEVITFKTRTFKRCFKEHLENNNITILKKSDLEIYKPTIVPNNNEISIEEISKKNSPKEKIIIHESEMELLFKISQNNREIFPLFDTKNFFIISHTNQLSELGTCDKIIIKIINNKPKDYNILMIYNIDNEEPLLVSILFKLNYLFLYLLLSIIKCNVERIPKQDWKIKNIYVEPENIDLVNSCKKVFPYTNIFFYNIEKYLKIWINLDIGACELNFNDLFKLIFENKTKDLNEITKVFHFILSIS